MIKVMLVDDHEMVRLGVSSYLSIQEDIEVVGEAENGKIGYEKALELRPDVILMDLVMEEMDGIDSTKAILKDWPEAKIIIVTSFIDDEKDLKYCFKEFDNNSCKFNNCNHINEPKCKVKDDLLKGFVEKTRYENYLLLFEEIKKRRQTW